MNSVFAPFVPSTKPVGGKQQVPACHCLRGGIGGRVAYTKIQKGHDKLLPNFSSLPCDAYPICRVFLKLARRGYPANLTFHRQQPCFLVLLCHHRIAKHRLRPENSQHQRAGITTTLESDSTLRYRPSAPSLSILSYRAYRTRPQ
jgi:hypothetical protein